MVVADIFEGVVHDAAATDKVSIVVCAIKEVLFAQRNQLPSLAEVLTL